MVQCYLTWLWSQPRQCNPLIVMCALAGSTWSWGDPISGENIRNYVYHNLYRINNLPPGQTGACIGAFYLQCVPLLSQIWDYRFRTFIQVGYWVVDTFTDSNPEVAIPTKTVHFPPFFNMLACVSIWGVKLLEAAPCPSTIHPGKGPKKEQDYPRFPATGQYTTARTFHQHGT